MKHLREADERDRERRKLDYRHWRDDRAAKLDAMPPALRAEVEATAYRNATAGRPVGLTVREVDACALRVVSRARLQRYGAMPETRAEWDRQNAEIRRALGLTADAEPAKEAA